MNRYETPEFNPHKVPLPSSDFFSFLNNEVYYIGAIENGECSRFLRLNEEVITYDSFEKTKFLFRWKETGYVICDADNPSTVLTLTFSNESGEYILSAERYQNRTDQIWEILPHISESGDIDGLCIRSSAKPGGESLCIGWNKHAVTVYKSSSPSASLVLYPLSDWVTYGMACMQYLEWSYSTDSDINKALKNYFSNLRTNISVENAFMYGTTGLIVNQSGGNFSKLNYVDVYMNDVACEVIAVCNAIRLLREDFDESNQDFFKLSLEFELSGLYKNSFKKFIVNTGSALGIKKFAAISTKDGGWGGDPDKIANCLEAHNVKFSKVHIKEQTVPKSKKNEEAIRKADELITESRCAVISYNFSTLHQAIHTFACTYSNNKVRTFNKHSNHTPEANYLNVNADDKTRGVYPSLAQVFENDSDAKFYVGYFLTE